MGNSNLGLNRTDEKNNNFFFQPNTLNVINSNKYKKINNNKNQPYKYILNKSSDVNYQKVNPSKIKQSMESLNNQIKKLNGLYYSNNNPAKLVTTNKNNSHIINSKKNSNLKSNSNYVLHKNNPNPNNLNNFQKLNQTYKINNNINKNYYITYDLKKMKFNFNNANTNLNSNNDYSDNESFLKVVIQLKTNLKIILFLIKVILIIVILNLVIMAIINIIKVVVYMVE